jgi:hypothetical protein
MVEIDSKLIILQQQPKSVTHTVCAEFRIVIFEIENASVKTLKWDIVTLSFRT